MRYTLSLAKKALPIMWLLFAVTMPDITNAGGMTGPRKILSMGCHNDSSGVCYLDIEGSAVGAVSCYGTTIRWDAVNVPGGKIQLSLLTAAYIAGKPVNFYIPDACFSLQPAYPTFGWNSF
jgi:hypothetical protein